MTGPDMANGIFELGGGLLQLSNCWRLMRDREVKGVNWQVTAFFAAWGYWNLFYYPHLGQWASFAGGLLIVVANTAWVAMALVPKDIRCHWSPLDVEVPAVDIDSQEDGMSPHCDDQVLHAPSMCVYCDRYPERQLERLRLHINFTGERVPGYSVCPSERRRSLETIEAWPGNRARRADRIVT